MSFEFEIFAGAKIMKKIGASKIVLVYFAEYGFMLHFVSETKCFAHQAKHSA